MSSAIGIEVEGFEELKQKIILLSNDKDKRREVLLILRQIAKPTLQAAKILAPVSKKAHWQAGKRTKLKIVPGNLKKSLNFIPSRANNPTVLVGASTKGNRNGWYANFVHEGHNVYNNPTKYNVYKYKTKTRNRSNLERVRGRKIGLNTVQGNVGGNPFLRTAYEATKSVVTADAERKMAAFIQRRIDKLSAL